MSERRPAGRVSVLHQPRLSRPHGVYEGSERRIAIGLVRDENQLEFQLQSTKREQRYTSREVVAHVLGTEAHADPAATRLIRAETSSTSCTRSRRIPRPRTGR